MSFKNSFLTNPQLHPNGFVVCKIQKILQQSFLQNETECLLLKPNREVASRLAAQRCIWAMDGPSLFN